MKPQPPNKRVLKRLEDERALLRSTFGVEPYLRTFVMGEEYRVECVTGNPAKAPEGLFAITIMLNRAGHWVKIYSNDRRKPRRALFTQPLVLFETELPCASFEEAVEVARVFLTRLAEES